LRRRSTIHVRGDGRLACGRRRRRRRRGNHADRRRDGHRRVHSSRTRGGDLRWHNSCSRRRKRRGCRGRGAGLWRGLGHSSRICVGRDGGPRRGRGHSRGGRTGHGDGGCCRYFCRTRSGSRHTHSSCIGGSDGRCCRGRRHGLGRGLGRGLVRRHVDDRACRIHSACVDDTIHGHDLGRRRRSGHSGGWKGDGHHCGRRRRDGGDLRARNGCRRGSN